MPTTSPAAPEPADVLASGRERRPVLRFVAVVLVALVVAGVYADRWQRDRERAALTERARAGTAAVLYADGRIRAALTYVSPTLGSAAVSVSVRESLARVVSGEAAARLPDLTAERAATSAVRVLPWHGEQRAARAAYVRYLDLRLAYLSAVADDLDALYVPHPELAEGQQRARAAYATAGAALG